MVLVEWYAINYDYNIPKTLDIIVQMGNKLIYRKTRLLMETIDKQKDIEKKPKKFIDNDRQMMGYFSYGISVISFFMIFITIVQGNNDSIFYIGAMVVFLIMGMILDQKI